jgi:hypothetical protein
VEEMLTEFWLGNLKRRNHLGDLGIDGKTVLTYEGVNWTHVVFASDQWWAVVYVVLNLWVP